MADRAVQLAGRTTDRPASPLRPIDDDSVEAALAILERGFPGKARAFWQAGFDRHRMTRPSNSPGAGYLLRDKGRDAGVILTFSSERPTAGGGRRQVVNLSSWYIDPESRGYAPKMLRAVLADRGALYTDVSATPTVRRLNTMMGFRSWHEGLIAVLVPCARLTAPAEASVVPLGEEPKGALRPAARRMLEDHQRMGCLVGVLADGGAWSPLIFVRARRWGVPGARLVYADNRALVLRHLGAVTRYLMNDNQMVLLIDGSKDEKVPGKVFFYPRLTQYKGDMRPDAIDMAYSELVYLNMLA